MARVLTLEDVEYAIKGGSVFACGGGGWGEHGRELGTLAVTIGRPELVSLDEVPDDAYIATAAAIGAPGGLTDWEMLGVDYVKAVSLLQEALGKPLYGLIIGQNGMSSTLNAWLPAALLGVKVIDAVGDLRAHPTGDMGSIGMANSPEIMIQTAVGGNRANNSYIELVTKGATAKVSPVLRKASDMSGGFIASCRNPLKASYVKQHAALSGISMAIELGKAITQAEPQGSQAVLDAICASTKGQILCQGEVVANTLKYTDEAFDIGLIKIQSPQGIYTIHVMNEHMAVELDGKRVASYPDVITTLDAEGKPVSAGQVLPRMKISLFHVSKTQIPLSSSVLDPSVYPYVEERLNIDLASYALEK